MKRLLWLLVFASAASPPAVRAAEPLSSTRSQADQARQFLGRICYSRRQVEDWLSGRTVLYGETYDAELGWVLANRRYRDGVDGAISEYRYAGARRMVRYAGRRCRINSYGDSFTHCDQVSDGETWQEVLAAHLGEPVRNYGVGGYSVYQAYLRMLRAETRTPGELIIFNIYDDDHFRNLNPWRNLRTRYTPQTRPGVLSPSLPYVLANPATGEFSERANPCPTRESVYRLCDVDWVTKQFAEDFVCQLEMARENLRRGTPEKSYDAILKLAAKHGIRRPLKDPAALAETVDQLDTAAGLFASMQIVEKIRQYATAHDKRLLLVLSFSPANVIRAIETGERFDQPFVDYLRMQRIPYIDLLAAHREDFAQFRVPANRYVARYYVGHYNPRGNFFLAFSIKDPLVRLLDPKPPAYTTDADRFVEPRDLTGPSLPAKNR